MSRISPQQKEGSLKKERKREEKEKREKREQ
jgi:hypothetical protein